MVAVATMRIAAISVAALLPITTRARVMLVKGDRRLSRVSLVSSSPEYRPDNRGETRNVAYYIDIAR